jgi:hypothetical protein
MIQTRNGAVVIAVSAMILFSTSEALAQSSCETLLRGGVFDEATQYGDSLRYAQARSYMCSHRERTFEETRSVGGSATVPIEGILVGFGLNDDRSNYNQALDSMCGASESEALDRATVRNSLRTVNAALVNAYTQCVARERGLSARAVTQGDTQFRLEYSYSAFPNAPNATVQLIELSEGVRCLGLPRVNDQVRTGFPPLQSSCTRQRDRAATIFMRTDYGDAVISLPGWRTETLRNQRQEGREHLHGWVRPNIDYRDVVCVRPQQDGYEMDPSTANFTPQWALIAPSERTDNVSRRCFRAEARQSDSRGVCYEVRMHVNEGEPPCQESWSVSATEVRNVRVLDWSVAED